MKTLTHSPAWVPMRTQLVLGLLAASLLFASGWADRAQAIPFTLQMIPVLVIGMLFTPRQAMLTVGATALLMAFTISAPRVAFTGGYMVGWLLAVGLMGWLLQSVRDDSFKRLDTLWRYALAGVFGYALVWFCGWAWLAFGVPQFGASKAFWGGVAPFLLGAPVKLAAAVLIAFALQPKLPRWQ
jgi:biotin transport system substrate-specific component